MKVYLVGSGPGDAELLTLKAKRLLEDAEVVLYDHLSSPEALKLAAHAEKFYVGKVRDNHTVPQEEITAQMIALWREGKRVVRLKGGDPYLFGRGGEECEALAEAGVPFEVVPGISSAIGAAAYAGIPLTHRDYASSVAFVTGHHPASIDWTKVARVDTLAIFMGAFHYPELAAALITAGKSPDTPAAAVTWATRGAQHTVGGTIESLQHDRIQPPAIIIVGEVARLAGKLNWFEALPLHGVKVLVTRAATAEARMQRHLEALGAEVLDYPTIAIAPPEAPVALSNVHTYDWLIFTSVNAVEKFVELLLASGQDIRAMRGKLCAIGPATRAALEGLHLRVDVVPREYVAESLAAALASENMQGQRVLLPRAAVARDIVPEALRHMGATVDIVEVYRTVVPDSGPAPSADWVAFTSSSTVKNFLALNEPGALAHYRIASIGPITSETLRKHGYEPTVEANPHTTEGIVHAIAAHHHPPRHRA